MLTAEPVSHFKLHNSNNSVLLDSFQNSGTLFFMATCLLASIHSSIGMSTVYYRNGEVCEVCAEEHGTRTQTQTQTYYPSGGSQRVVYRPSSSSSYITNRDDTYYQGSSSSKFISICIFSLLEIDSTPPTHPSTMHRVT